VRRLAVALVLAVDVLHELLISCTVSAQRGRKTSQRRRCKRGGGRDGGDEKAPSPSSKMACGGAGCVE
jgi:hypothetical protein